MIATIGLIRGGLASGSSSSSGVYMIDYRLRELKIELSRDCPLHCLHCSSNGMPNASERLEPRKVSELIKEFADMGGEKVCISGGEPLCYDGLLSVVDGSKSLGIDISLYTTGIVHNGVTAKPISEQVAVFLAEKKVKTVFSIHGATARTHDKLTRVEGSFQSTVTAIERVKDAGAMVEVHVVPTLLNFDELGAIAKLVVSLNIHKISWLRFVPQGRGLSNKGILQLSKDQMQQLATKMEEMRQDYPTVMIRAGAPFNILCPAEPAPCEAGISILTVGPDGTASPCDAFKRFRFQDNFGNVLRHSLNDVWQRSAFLNTVRIMHEPTLLSPCTSCESYLRCESGCLAQKAIRIGRITEGKDPDCQLGKSEAVRDAVEAISVL